MRLLRNRSMAFYFSFVLLLTTALVNSTLAAFADWAQSRSLSQAGP